MLRIYLFILSIVIFVSKIYCDMMPIVRIEMNNAGFHRDLHYTIEFDYPLAGKDCEYYLEQKLPAEVYIDVNQLDDLKRLKKLNAIYPKLVNVEMPTEKSTGLTVLLYGVPKITDSIKLPIHFRYHAPGKQKFATVRINTLQMFMRCPDDDLSNYDEVLADPNNNYCLNENEFTLPQYSAPDNCDWKLLKSTIRLKAPLEAKIPVGDANLYPFVLYATIFISWAAAIWFVLNTQKIIKKINNTLEKQMKKNRKEI